MAINTVSASSGVLLSKEEKASTIPVVNFNRITLDTKNQTTTALGEIFSDLAISLDMSVEIKFSSALFSSNANFMEHIGVCVVRTINEKSKEIFKGPMTNLLTKSSSGDSEVSPRIDPRTEKHVMRVSFKKSDVLTSPADSPTNLSYHAYCFLDLKSLARSLGVEDIPELAKTKGPISSERIISNGKVNSTSHVFYVTSQFPENLRGTFWIGPVIQSGNGWAAAKWGSSSELIPANPALNLEKIEVTNTKIQDFRLLRKIPNLNINLKPDTFSPIVIKGKDNFDNSIENPDTYISNAFLTRDMQNNCRFIFEFDYEKTLTRESKFGKIMTNPRVPEATKQKISLYSKITNLQIIRRQVETARSYNRLSSVTLGINRSELNPEIQIIVETFSDPTKNNLLKTSKSWAPGIPIGNRENEEVGSIMEIPSVKYSPKQTKTIAVTDKSISQLTNGTFQYGVRIQIEDGSIRFLNKRLKSLQTIRDYLVGYYNLIQVPVASYSGTVTSISGYYNLIFETQAGGNRANLVEKTEINSLRTELGFFIGSLDPTETLYPWVIAPEYIVDTLESISDFSLIPETKRIAVATTIQTSAAILAGSAPASRLSATNLQSNTTDSFNEGAALFALKSLLNPATATSESILEVMSTLDAIVQKIRNMMGSSAEIEQANTSVKRLGVARNSKVSVMELEDYFVELFDTRLSTLPAIDYIGFTGIVDAVPGPRNPRVSLIPGSDVNSLDIQDTKTAGAAAGPNGITADDWQSRVVDEEEMGVDPKMESPESEATDLSTKEKRRQNLREKRAEIKGSKMTFIPAGPQKLTPSIIDSRDGLIIERSITVKGYAKSQPYVKMQNTIISRSMGRGISSTMTNQDNLNLVMSALNVSVDTSKTPMAVQTSLITGQNNASPLVPIAKILGSQDLQRDNVENLQKNGCISSADAGSGATALELAINQSRAIPLTQNLANIVASNGALDQITPLVNGNSKRSSGIMAPKGSPINPVEAVAHQIPALKFSLGMPANIAIFMGYEKDSAGGFMIKRPIFKIPEKAEWPEILRKLRSRNNRFDVLLCRAKKEDNSNSASGLTVVETNTYFLITKNTASLMNGSSKRRSRSSQPDQTAGTQRPRRPSSPIGKISVDDIPPAALNSTEGIT